MENKESQLRDKNILYIVHNYNSFQKDPIEESSKYFNKVYVLVRYKPISVIAKYLPFKGLKKFDDSYVIDTKNIPSNVDIIKTPFWYLPYGIFNKMLGSLHLRAVKKAIKKHNIKFDLVHSHFVWSSGYVGMCLKKEYKVPFVVTGHGYDVYKLPFSSKYWRDQITQILNSADRIITVSKYNEDYLNKLEINSEKITVIGNGFNPKLFSPLDKKEIRKELGISLEKRICVSVGNLEKIKGQDILIEAIKILRDRGEQIYCYIIGNGSRFKLLQSLIKRYHLEDNIFLLGVKPHYEIKKYIGMSDIFVIPSRRESASVVLLEALACGSGVVASKVGIVPEVLTDNSYGYVIDVENSKDLAKGISKAVSQNWNQEKISEYAQQFTWEKSVKRIIKIYNELLS